MTRDAVSRGEGPVPPEVELPPGVVEDPHGGLSWYLNLSDGRTLRLSEIAEGEFTAERCDVSP